MASTPILTQLERAIETDGGDAAIFDRFRSGERISEIMDGYGLSRGMWYNWLKAGGADRKAAYEEAKTDSADAYADKAEDTLVDERLAIAPTNAEVSLANSKSKFYQWLAGKRNRAAYGDDALVALNVTQNIGSMHLSALLEGGLVPFERPSDLDQIEEAEVLSIEPGEPVVLDACDDFVADVATFDNPPREEVAGAIRKVWEGSVLDDLLVDEED